MYIHTYQYLSLSLSLSLFLSLCERCYTTSMLHPRNLLGWLRLGWLKIAEVKSLKSQEAGEGSSGIRTAGHAGGHARRSEGGQAYSAEMDVI